MEIRNLTTFLRVATLQNFTHASRELGYSQSNVSAQIKQLEQEIGVNLFDRIGRNVYLTAYGKSILPYAQQIVSTASYLENYMKSPEAIEGSIRVGITDSLFELLSANILLLFHHRFPRVQLELIVDATTTLQSQLQHGLIDAACLIGDPLPDSEWRIWNATEISVVFVANPQHPLSSEKNISLETISKQEMILMEESAPYNRHFQNALSSLRLSCRPFLRIQSADAARNLVERENCISLLPLYTVHSSVSEGNLCILDVENWSNTQSVQLVLHRNKNITPQIEGFLETMLMALNSALNEQLFNKSI